ncbi:MAG TPA: DoxX family protein [Chitinophagaceae bacterium]|nr:DoxX family protein [Chitinophagaceae bacterium]
MKKINVAYWVTTILIAGFILFTAVPNIMVNDDSVKLINTSMGFPKYMIPFLGVAKALGVIAILT